MTFLLAHWRIVLVGLLVASLAAYASMMRLQRDAVRAEYAEFKTKVAQAAAAAAEEALKKTIADEKRKEAADAENSAALATLAATIGKLRRERPASSFVPAATAGSSRPDLACFDRAEYQRADGIFTEGTRGLADEGTKSTVDLDSAKAWAGGRE